MPAGVLLELATPDYTLVPIQAGGHMFKSLSAAGLNLTAEAGQPQPADGERAARRAA